MNKVLRFLTLLLVIACCPLQLPGQEFSPPDPLAAQNIVGPTDELGDLFKRALKNRKAANNEAAQLLLTDLLAKATLLDDQYTIAKAHYYLGKSYLATQNYPQALENFLAVLPFTAPIVSDKRHARSLSNIAYIYQQIGDYDNALRYQYKALTTQETMGDSSGMMQTYYTLGNIFFYYKKQYSKAEQYYHKTYNLAKATDNLNITVLTMCALGSCFEKQDRLEQAEHINFEAYHLADSMHHKLGQVSALQNIGTIYTKKEKFENAADYLQQSIDLARKIDLPWGVMVGKKYLGFLYLKQGNVTAAKDYFFESLELAANINDVHQQMELHQALSGVFESEDQKNLAFDQLKQYQELEASIYDENMLDEIYALEYIEERVRQEEELKSSNLTIELLKEQAKYRQIRTYLLLVLFIATLIVASLIGYYYLRKQQMYEVLEKTSNLLEEKNIQIEKSNKELAVANSDLKQFTYAASHDLKAPLRTISSFTTLLRRRNKATLDENSEEYFDFILGAVDRMQTLLTDLLDYAKLGSEHIPEKTVDLNQVVRASLFNLQESIDQTNAQIALPSSFPKVKGHETQLLQVFQNLIGNALKFHGPEPPVLQVNFESREGHYLFSIKDNGIGIADDQKEKIFKMFARLNDHARFEGTGIGLATCRKIIERHGGQIWVDSSPGEGSTFYFTLPVSNLRQLKAKAVPISKNDAKIHTKFQIQK
jgi:signal transduction histidine kinase/Tfp pilus assembly protein PilF